MFWYIIAKQDAYLIWSHADIKRTGCPLTVSAYLSAETGLSRKTYAIADLSVCRASKAKVKYTSTEKPRLMATRPKLLLCVSMYCLCMHYTKMLQWSI